jgi:hypothetical protein
MTTKLEIQKLLLCFEQWSLEYHNASELSATADAELSKCSEVMNDLDANLKDFQELNMMEKFVSLYVMSWLTCKKRRESLKRKSR